MVDAKPLLLVDDDDNDLELFQRALKRLGIEEQLATAHDGVEALEYLESQLPEALPKVMVIDYKMPRMDGLRLLLALRNDPRFKSIPVVMLTSSQDRNDIAQAYAAGANAYLLKPISFSKFNEDVAVLVKFWLQMNLVGRENRSI